MAAPGHLAVSGAFLFHGPAFARLRPISDILLIRIVGSCLQEYYGYLCLTSLMEKSNQRPRYMGLRNTEALLFRRGYPLSDHRL
jgi:hypothetical protein